VLRRGGHFTEILNSGAYKAHGALLGALAVTFNALWYRVRGAVRGPAYKLLFVSPSGADMAAVAGLVKECKLKVVIDRVRARRCSESLG
jgi:hypothetical protein